MFSPWRSDGSVSRRCLRWDLPLGGEQMSGMFNSSLCRCRHNRWTWLQLSQPVPLGRSRCLGWRPTRCTSGSWRCWTCRSRTTAVRDQQRNYCCCADSDLHLSTCLSETLSSTAENRLQLLINSWQTYLVFIHFIHLVFTNLTQKTEIIANKDWHRLTKTNKD